MLANCRACGCEIKPHTSDNAVHSVAAFLVRDSVRVAKQTLYGATADVGTYVLDEHVSNGTFAAALLAQVVVRVRACAIARDCWFGVDDEVCSAVIAHAGKLVDYESNLSMALRNL